MAESSDLYGHFAERVLKGDIDLDTDTLKCALMKTAHSFNEEHDDWSDVSANELDNGNGYTTGGATLANQAISYATGRTRFYADDTSWASASFSAYYAVIYDDTHATDALVACIDFNGVKTSSGGTFSIEWDDTDKIFYFDVSP